MHGWSSCAEAMGKEIFQQPHTGLAQYNPRAQYAVSMACTLYMPSILLWYICTVLPCMYSALSRELTNAASRAWETGTGMQGLTKHMANGPI